MALRFSNADADLDATGLIEVIAGGGAVIAATQHRVAVAASLLHEERAEDYMARCAELDTKQHTTVTGFLDAALAAQCGNDPWARFGPDGLEQTTAELGAALTITPAQARDLIAEGDAIRYRLPLTAKHYASGRIDRRRFQIAQSRTKRSGTEAVHIIDEHLAKAIRTRPPMSITRFTALVDALVAHHDPETIRDQRERARTDRDVTIRPDRFQTGQSRLKGNLPDADAAALNARLDAITATVHKTDPRTKAQRRADALLALANDRTSLDCFCDDCTAARVATSGTDCDIDASTSDAAISDDPATDMPAAEALAPPSKAGVAPAQPMFHIVVNLSTLLGLDEQPGFLDGRGIVDADTLRKLLTDAERHFINPAQWQQPSTNDASTEEAKRTARAALTYTPSRKLQSLVRSGELCCAFPGCNHPVWDADLDHTTPFDRASPTAGGRTTRRNLKPLCRFHHRVKTFADWRDYQDHSGRAFFGSPTGHVYVGNAITGIDVFGIGTGTDIITGPVPAKPPDAPARMTFEQRRLRDIAKAERARARWEEQNPPPF